MEQTKGAQGHRYSTFGSVVKKSRALARDFLLRAERFNNDWPSAPVVCSIFILHQA